MAEHAVTIAATGAVINFTATPANVAISNTSGGTPPKYVRLTSTQACYVRLSIGAGTAAAGDILVQPADALIVRSHGFTHVNAVQVTAGGVLQISPLEDQ